MENKPTAAPENELNLKQVFSDDPIKPSERPVRPSAPLTDEEDDALAGAAALSFDKPTVLDEDFAARKAAQPRHPAARTAPAAAQRRPAQKPRSAQRRTASRLYSGETVSDAARRIAREFFILLLVLLLVSGGFWLKSAVSDFLADDTYASLAQSTLYAEGVRCRTVTLDADALPDGYAAAQAVCTQLGYPITDRSGFVKTEDQLIFASEVADCMAPAMPDAQIQVANGLSNRDLLIRIHESLSADRPVIVLLSENSAEGVCLQYAVVTGMNAEQDTVTVVNPNSGEIQYTMEEFIDATRFKTYTKMPFQVRLALTFGSLSRNTAVFVE
ncbi:MAG: hypothetical protein ACI4GO_08935 [Hominenteromicrobium sp.]